MQGLNFAGAFTVVLMNSLCQSCVLLEQLQSKVVIYALLRQLHRMQHRNQHAANPIPEARNQGLDLNKLQKTSCCWVLLQCSLLLRGSVLLGSTWMSQDLSPTGQIQWCAKAAAETRTIFSENFKSIYKSTKQVSFLHSDQRWIQNWAWSAAHTDKYCRLGDSQPQVHNCKRVSQTVHPAQAPQTSKGDLSSDADKSNNGWSCSGCCFTLPFCVLHWSASLRLFTCTKHGLLPLWFDRTEGNTHPWVGIWYINRTIICCIGNDGKGFH